MNGGGLRGSKPAATRLRGVPATGNGAFPTNRRWNHNEAIDFLDMQAKVVLAQYRFSLSNAWDLDFAARWFDNSEHRIYRDPMGLIYRHGDGTAEWMTRQLRNHLRVNEALATNANAVLRFSTGALEHMLMFGADHYQSRFGFQRPDRQLCSAARWRTCGPRSCHKPR